MRALSRKTKDIFDAELNIDTAAEVPIWRLKISSANAKFAGRYQTVSPDLFFQTLALVPADLQGVTFVDLGCGTGRTLILAARRGFQRIVGVEFSQELANIARRNMLKVGITAEILEMDACQYKFPEGNLLIYMYNPFGGGVMQSVIGNLLEGRHYNSDKAFVVYLNPVQSSLFESKSEFELVGKADQARVWKLN
jgi:16S rRNA G966 N2-methylase RsmD